MKKSLLFMACCIGLMLMASCKKHVAPTISFIQAEGYLTENAEVFTNESYWFGFVATGEKLNRVETTLTQNGEVINSYPIVFDEQETYTDSFEISFPVTGTITITCTVTDAEGLSASKSFNVFVVEKDPITPIISIVPGFADESTEIYSGEMLEVAFVATGEKLTRIGMVISQNDNILYSDNQELGNLASYEYWDHITIDAIGIVQISVFVEDAIGQTASVEFNILYKERPNSKYVGHYEGDIFYSGIVDLFINGLDSTHQEVTDRAITVALDLREGVSPFDIIGTCRFDNQNMYINGTVDDYGITFEGSDAEFTLTYEMNGFTISPVIYVTYNINGVLENEQLLLNGPCSGNGEIHLFVYNGNVAIDGNISGSLEKTK